MNTPEGLMDNGPSPFMGGGVYSNTVSGVSNLTWFMARVSSNLGRTGSLTSFQVRLKSSGAIDFAYGLPTSGPILSGAATQSVVGISPGGGAPGDLVNFPSLAGVSGGLDTSAIRSTCQLFPLAHLPAASLANTGISFLRQANGGYKVSSRAFPVYQDTVLAGRIVENAAPVANASIRLSSGEVAITNDRGFFAAVINKAPIYVALDATGDNTGRSWNHAFTSLQSALDAAAPGDEIWVKQGTYYPEKTPSGNIANPYLFAGTREYFENSGRFIASVEKRVRVYGGFHGDELGRHQRNWKRYSTILSGDIRFRPGVTAVCSRVIALSSESELDGFIVQKSSQVGVDVAANAVVRNCLVRDHGNTGVKLGQSSSLVASVVTTVVSTNGSAVQFSGANGRMENCMVVGNSSLSASGAAAGISVKSSGSSVNGCTLAQNVSSSGEKQNWTFEMYITLHQK